ncbi:hypothetical protein BHM03_00047950, partial [Ensete ventricosum]
EGIWKLVRNTLGDRWRKTIRLVARIPKTTELVGGAFDGGTISAGGCTACTHFFHEFAKGIGKLARNTPGDHRRKTVRLIARMSEAVELAGNSREENDEGRNGSESYHSIT